MKIHPLAASFLIFHLHLNPAAWAAALLVPKDFKTIQAAIDAHATPNTALTTNVQDESVTLTGPRGVVERNVCKAK